MELKAGEIVEHAVRRQNVNISELSRKMNVNRRTLYNWFQQKELKADIIYGIGEVINYDFSDDFQEGLKNQPLKTSNKRKTVGKTQADTSDTVFYWMEKYITLLEEYRVLLQKTSLTQISDNFKNGHN